MRCGVLTRDVYPTQPGRVWGDKVRPPRLACPAGILSRAVHRGKVRDRKPD